MFYRRFAVLRGTSPGILTIRLFGIGGLRQSFPATGKIDFGRIPNKSFGRSKSYIPSVFHAELPSQFSFLRRTGYTSIVYFFGTDNINRFVTMTCSLHPLLLLGGKYVLGIDQFP